MTTQRPVRAGTAATDRAVLRAYRPADRDAVCQLWIAAWNATLPEIDFSRRQTWFTDWLATHLASAGVVLCAVDDTDDVCGFVGFDPPSGHMEQVAVHPDAFGRGVAKALLDSAKSLCPGGITLRVNQENPRAVAFYRREGFLISAEGVNPGGRRLVYDMTWRPDAARHERT